VHFECVQQPTHMESMYSAVVILLCSGNNSAHCKIFIVFVVWAFKVPM